MLERNQNNSYFRAQKLKKISDRYKFLNQEINFQQLCCGQGTIQKNRRDFVEVVDKTLASLDHFYKKFIMAEFFSKNRDDQFWWTAIYSRSTYYRYRKESIERFLKVFYEFYKQVYGFNYYDAIQL